MSLKKVAAVLFALVALVAVTASSASAAVATTRAEWYTGASPGTTLPVGTDLTAKGEIAFHGTKEEEEKGIKKAVFTTVIGAKPIKLTSTEIECIGCKITNKEVTGKAGAIAYGEGKITFKNVTVSEPLGCTVKGDTGVVGDVTTKQLVIHADWMDTSKGGKEEPPVTNHAFVQFIPAAGATTTFAQFTLENGECSGISGARNVFGTVFGESKNDTGVFAKSQGLTFSPEIQSTAGGALNVGGIAANLTGGATFHAFTEAEKPVEVEFAVKP